jgi:predicted transcriptional regulator
MLDNGEKMDSIQIKNKKERLSFFVNSDLSDKITQISQHTRLTVSEIARKALLKYIDEIEKEKIEKELEEGYKANYDYYLKSQEDWKYADKE